MKDESLKLCNDITDLLYKNGVRNVCISPGLRNTAISLSFVKHGKFNCHSILDERAAGYFALGISLKTSSAAVLICTSGTATANYFPAIIEASQSRIPLIVLTADRPENLLNSGENQTINQKYIYGNFVRKSVSLNQHSNLISMIDSLQFINPKVTGIIKGPIHFNIHLDDFNTYQKYSKNKISTYNTKSKKTLNFNWNNLSFEDIYNLHNYQRPLIIIGRLNKPLNNQLINKLAKHLKAPILADSLSQMRFSNNTLGLFEHYIDNDNIDPDLIIRIGQKPISKKLCAQLNKWENNKVNPLEFSSLLIDEDGRFNDNSPAVVKTNYKEFINFIIKHTNENKNNDFNKHILSLEKKITEIIHDENEWSELIIAKLCLSSIKENENLVIGNSMPIRYIDMLGRLAKNIHTYSNRGASGIDGIIATAFGISNSSKAKTTLLIGDLSFIYDQTSLLIGKQLKIDLTIIIINNNGGGIFSLLPVSKEINKKIFNEYWTTSHNIDLKKIATLYEVTYQKVTSKKQLNSALIKFNNTHGINIIDAQIDIENNKKILIHLKKRIKKGIA